MCPSEKLIHLWNPVLVPWNKANKRSGELAQRMRCSGEGAWQLSQAEISWIPSLFYTPLLTWLQMSYLAHLNLTFLICKMRVLTISTLQNIYGKIHANLVLREVFRVVEQTASCLPNSIPPSYVDMCTKTPPPLQIRGGHVARLWPGMCKQWGFWKNI